MANKYYPDSSGIPKCPTGIRGLDEITLGGLPRGRPTLVCGGAGSGKTLLGMEFLIRGARDFDEPGVCISFEETAAELSSNVLSLGFDVGALIAQNKLAIDYILIERSMIEVTGEYDLEALFIRLAHAVDLIDAKRVVIDSVEALFSGFSNQMILRSELRRLFMWLKQRGLTAVITGERGQGSFTRHGLEEYISDCVILLDHRVAETVLTRRLRVAKYRGSLHGTNEYPFLIEDDGISVLPVTSLDLTYPVSNERVSSGVTALDAMLGGQGYFRGSNILISGTAGTGKTSLLAHFADAACARGERCVFFSFEESAQQIVRNMRSIGMDLGGWADKDLLRFQAARPTTFGLEMHLAKIQKIIKEFKPSIALLDPINGLLQSGTLSETRSMLLRLIDYLKEKQITTLMTTLTGDSDHMEQTDVSISSLVDTWLLLRDIECGGEKNRGFYILKARGIAHSNQIREFRLTNQGIELRDVYLGEGGVLTGSSRVAQEARDRVSQMSAGHEMASKQFLIKRKCLALDAQIAALRLDLETENLESLQLMAQQELNAAAYEQYRMEMVRSRLGNVEPGNGLSSKAGENGHE